MPIGLVEEVEYDIKNFASTPGATIFLFTDDLVDNLCDLKQATLPIFNIQWISKSPQDMIERFKNNFRASRPTIEDDLTMLVIKRPS